MLHDIGGAHKGIERSENLLERKAAALQKELKGLEMEAQKNLHQAEADLRKRLDDSNRRNALLEQKLEAVEGVFGARVKDAEARSAASESALQHQVTVLHDEASAQIEEVEQRLGQAREKLSADLSDRVLDLNQNVQRLHHDLDLSARKVGSEVRAELLGELGEVQEHLARVDDQLVFFQGEIAPEVILNLIRKDVQVAAEQSVHEALSKFQKHWKCAVEWKFDCVVQCLHSLYVKVGLSPAGTLYSLQRFQQDVFKPPKAITSRPASIEGRSEASPSVTNDVTPPRNSGPGLGSVTSQSRARTPRK
jgi:hypothetical protein